MERKRDGFVPLGDVPIRLPSIEGRGRAMSANARHHFTLLRQVNQLIEAGEAEPDLGFMARLLALCSLPRTNPRDREKYIRRNGPYKLIMQAGGDPGSAPVREPAPAAPGVGLFRSGADAKPRVGARPVAVRVHAASRPGRSERRAPRGTRAPQKSNAAAL